MKNIFAGECRDGYIKLTTDRDCLPCEIIRFSEHVVVDNDDLMTKAHLLEQRGFVVCVDTEEIFYETPKIKKGLRFYHARVLDTIKFDGKSPQLYEITRIARGTVYYRAVADYGTRQALVGNPECTPVEKFPTICKEVINA